MPAYQNDIYPLSLETKRIFCAYHQTEFLTNFCQQKQCLMPLCPSCIAQHTEQHFQEGKRPSYTNINEALNKAKQSCYCTIVTLEQYKKINQDIFSYISSLQQNIHHQLQLSRNKIFDLITQIYIQYEARLIKQICNNYQQKNVYSIDESIKASKFIDQEISNLYQRISLLKGDDCLSSLITYYAVDQQGYKQALQQFDQYFEKNRTTGKIQIIIIQEKLKKITQNFCDNLLSVEAIVDNFEKKPEEPIESSNLKSKRYGFNKTSGMTTMRGSNRTIFDKQNDQNNRKISPTKNNSLQKGMNKQPGQIKDISFNKMDNGVSHQSVGIRRQQPIVKSINESMSRNASHRRSIMMMQSPNDQKGTQYESKRLIRDFRRP